MDSVVKVLMSRDGKRKVEIFRAADGTYGFEELYFSEEPRERCWIAADAEIAEREARGRVEWLRREGEVGPSGQND